MTDYDGQSNDGYIGTSQNGTGGNVTIDSDVGDQHNRRDVIGGFSRNDSGDADARSNSVTMSGGNVAGNIYGSRSQTNGGNAGATGNRVTMNGGEVAGEVYGGSSRSVSGTASSQYNTVTISGVVTDAVYGGDSSSSSGTAIATGNSVTMSGGTVGILISGGSSSSASGTAIATGNSVTMSGGVTDTIYGGSSSSNSGTANATGNTVTMSGGVTDTIYGGSSRSSSSTSTSPTLSATGNRVLISGGTVTGNVFGGHSRSDDVASASPTLSATGNTVTISGGTVTGGVYGGFSTNSNSSSCIASATHNTVTLMGTPVFGANSFLQGGQVAVSGGGGDARTGNTLNVFTSGITVQSIGNFQHYNFALHHGTGAGLSLTSTAGAFQAGDVVRVPYALPGGALHAGQQVTLLTSANALTGPNTAGLLPAGQARQGVALVYDYTLGTDSNNKNIWANINGVSAAPEGKAMSEGRAASLGFANLGADLVAGTGMDSVRGAAASGGLSGGSDTGYGLIPFFAVQGSSLRYNTGSHTDVNGVALMTGLAKQWQAPTMDVLAGVFFEAAFGSTKTHNSFSSGSANGKGDTRTLGGGILARLDMTDTALKGLYAEASLRVGSLNNDYKNSDLRDYAGNSAAYDVDSLYYGLHAGLGYIWNITDRASLDASAKYFWTHQQGQDVTILGDKFSFKDSDSHRTRLGARLGYAVTEEVTPYIGAAWEYEFDGKSRATVYGFDVPAPGLEGSTGIGELGLTWKPAKAQGFAVNLGVQGYTGMREGISGTLQLKYEF